MNRLALSFIHKNEGKYAIQMILSARPIIDFVAFLDTGSTDSSFEDVKAFLEENGIPYGAQKVQFTNFGDMRNQAIDLVPDEYNWILMLDADEVILEKDFDKIHSLINNPDIDAYAIPRFNWVDQIWGRVTEIYPDHQSRLFRARPRGKIHYEGEIHEQLDGYKVRHNLEIGDPIFQGYSDQLHIHHIKLFTKSLEELENRERFYSQFSARAAAENSVKEPQMNEQEFDLSTVRRLHTLPATPWTGTPDRAIWCEWHHPAEASRSLSSLISNVESQNWRRFIIPGGTCVDIGAHSGDTAIPLALFCFDSSRQKPGCVLAAEPNPGVIPVLEINLAVNASLADFKIAKVAVTERDIDWVEIADHGNANCNGGILEGGYSQPLASRLQDAAQIKHRVRGVSFTTLLSENLSEAQVRALTFVKIDCEGYDKTIIRGARPVLEQLQPTLYVEWFAWFEPADDADLFAAIDEIGYTPLVPHSLELAKISQRMSDLICVPKSRMSKDGSVQF